jgi:ABC-type lipoprotein export system ATPase subunit
MPLLSIHDLRKDHTDPDGRVRTVLEVPAFELEAGEQVALTGRSGCGKTTFLDLVAGIATPDAGSIRLDGRELVGLPDAARDRLRAREIGYVYQRFHLLDAYSALENVLLGMMFGPGPDRARARELLVRLGLEERLHHHPDQLSIGQQQRVAVARALAARPRLVLADEPTGSLDAASAAEAMGLLREACAEAGAALLVVSHDPVLVAGFERREDLGELNRAGTGGRG